MKRLLIPFYFLMLVWLAAGCSEEDDKKNTLSVNSTTVNFAANGGAFNLTIKTDAKSWTIDNSVPEWMALSASEGSGGNATVTLSVGTRSLENRTGTLLIQAGNADPVSVSVTQVSSDFLYVISTNVTSLTFKKSGESKTLKVITDAIAWNLVCNDAWLQIDKTSGSKGTTSITITAIENPNDEARTASIAISADNSATVQVAVTQKGSLYPNYNTSPQTPDNSGMSSNAVTLAAKVKLGWNIGNSLEAIGGETAWGNPKVSKALIDLVKANGFDAIRIPCSWNQNMQNNATAELKTSWLQRVEEVVQYCVDNDMHVVLNIHWDGGWLESNCTPEKQEETNAKQKAFWEQIATHFRDYDEHLMFASANEPHVENATQMAVLDSYHQTFVNAVRSTGGRNSYRVLIVQGPSTDIEKTNTLMSALPTDEAEDRLMVEVHYYTPYQFCLMTKDESWGKMFYYWGDGYHHATMTDRNATWGEEASLKDFFRMMKTKFVDNGIPVVLGEFGAVRRDLTGDDLTLHLSSRAYYLKTVVKEAKANGLLPFYWDAGNLGVNTMSLFNRSNNTVYDQQALDALVEGAQ